MTNIITFLSRYSLTVIGSDQMGEAEFNLFGRLAEQVIGVSIHQLIRHNQPVRHPVLNDAIAAARVRFPPPEVSTKLGNRYRFVAGVTRESFLKPQTSFTVHKVEAIFPRVCPHSSADTIIPATSWEIDTPMVTLATPAHNLFVSEPGPSNRVSDTSTNPDSYSTHVMEALDQAFSVAIERADAFRKVYHTTLSISSASHWKIKLVLNDHY